MIALLPGSAQWHLEGIDSHRLWEHSRFCPRDAETRGPLQPDPMDSRFRPASPPPTAARHGFAATLADCCLIDLPQIGDHRGSLTFLENGDRSLTFAIRRVFYVYDIPSGTKRGAHAHRSLEEVLVCLAGSVVITLDDGSGRESFVLDRPARGLYIPPMIWSGQSDFAAGSLLLVVASQPFDEADYVRDYAAFRRARHAT